MKLQIMLIRMFIYEIAAYSSSSLLIVFALRVKVLMMLMLLRFRPSGWSQPRDLHIVVSGQVTTFVSESQ